MEINKWQKKRRIFRRLFLRSGRDRPIRQRKIVSFENTEPDTVLHTITVTHVDKTNTANNAITTRL